MLMERRLWGVFGDLREGNIEYSKSNFKLQGAYMTGSKRSFLCDGDQIKVVP